MILLIDNYDSFTYNLYQYFGELGEEAMVVRNDGIKLENIMVLQPMAIILSPGPGRPDEAGICIEIVRKFYEKIPILGICLGHQAIGCAFGASVGKAKKIMHGKTSRISHAGLQLFQGLAEPMEAMRYHSLALEEPTLPRELEVLARSIEDGEIMAIRHRNFPIYGLQFHPESIGTASGKKLLENFLTEVRKGHKNDENLSATVI